MSYDYLKQAHSKPLTIGDLQTGDWFTLFPADGDDHGHGGFRGATAILEKIEPKHPGPDWHKDARITCINISHRSPVYSGETDLPLNTPVVPLMKPAKERL